MAVAGIDIGSSGCKIVVFDEHNICSLKVYHEYAIKRYQEQQELDADIIWDAVKKCIMTAAQKVKNLQAITITSFGESFVLLDKDDQVIFPVMMYADTRGSEQALKMAHTFNRNELAGVTGAGIHYMFSLPKLLWVKENCPDVFKRIKHIALIQDYIVYRLTGKLQIDYSMAARTLAFDIKKKIWAKDLLAYAGLDSELLSQPVPSGTVAGVINPALTKKWGIPSGITIVSGCHDQVAAAVGTGVFTSGCAVDGTGTVECITPLVDALPDMEVLSQGGIAVVPYVLADKYVCYAFSFVGGALIKWYRDNFAKYEKELAKEHQKDVYSILEEGIDLVPGDILVLPHFNGAATPYMDGEAKGAMLGLTLAHTAKDIYKALMEGVTYEMLTNILFLKKAGIELSRLHATGGGAKSALWLQLKANILDKDIVSLQSDEAGAAGSAMLAAVAIGKYKDVLTAAKHFVQLGKIYAPQAAYHEVYAKKYENYKRLYEMLKAVR